MKNGQKVEHIEKKQKKLKNKNKNKNKKTKKQQKTKYNKKQNTKKNTPQKKIKMLIPTEIISFIFRHYEEYIYFAKQRNLICTCLLHNAIEDKYQNVNINRVLKKVLLVIYISCNNVNNNKQGYYKMEIYKKISLFNTMSRNYNKNLIIDPFFCLTNDTNTPFEKWEKNNQYEEWKKKNSYLFN